MPDKEGDAVYRVVVKQAVEQHLAVARDRASARTISAKWEKLSRSVWEFLGKHQGLRSDGHNVMVYHDSGDLGGFGRGEQIPRARQCGWRPGSKEKVGTPRPVADDPNSPAAISWAACGRGH